MSEGCWTIADASRALAERRLSPVELTRACLDRVERLDGKLNAVILLRAEEALAEARAAEAAIAAGRSLGPLHGIPIGLKDIIETAGIRTTGHSRLRLTHVPETDATVAARLKAAGTVLLGKLATHEFAFGGPSFDLPFPPARNPWNPACLPGGSSSGSAAGVAAGLVLGALGTDTGGSVRVPAAFCGIAGLKPTYGRVSRAGIFPLAFSLDHCGPMAWTSADCALLLQALAGHDPADPASLDAPVPDYAAVLTGELKGLRIGLIRHFYAEDDALHPAQGAAIEEAARALRERGAAVEEVRLSPLARYHAASLVITLSEAFAVHGWNLRRRPQEYGEFFRHRVMLGAFIDAADYVQATRQRRELTAEMESALGRHDALVTATAFGPAGPIDKVPKFYLMEKPLLTTPANLTGHPAHSVCCGFTGDGMPLAMQIIGRRLDEATVLRIGDAYERATSWRGRRPRLA